MAGEFAETRKKVYEYYDKVGQLNIKPYQFPRDVDEVYYNVEAFFVRLLEIVSRENSTRKFGNVNEILALLGASAGDMGMDITFTYYPGIGKWDVQFGSVEDYMNLPHLLKHFGLMWRWKPAPNRLAEPEEGSIDFDSVTVNEGNGDMFVYDRGGRD